MVYQVKSEDDFNEQVKKAGDKLVVVDFFATWCAPCKRIAPAFADLHTVFPDVTYLKVDIDEVEELMEEYEITAMPTFLFLGRGNEMDRQTGANLEAIIGKITTNRKVLQEWIKTEIANTVVEPETPEPKEEPTPGTTEQKAEPVTQETQVQTQTQEQE